MADNKKIEKPGLKKVTGGATPSTQMNQPAAPGKVSRTGDKLDSAALKRTSGGKDSSATFTEGDVSNTKGPRKPNPNRDITPLR